MAKDSTKQPTASQPIPAPAKPSYEGGTVPKTFDPKDLGTKFFSDMERVYAQGPKVNPISSFVDYSADTKNLIGQGINNSGNVGAELGGVATGDVGSSNPFYMSGPDYGSGFVDDLAGGRADLGNDYKGGNIGAIGAGGPAGNSYKGGNLDAIAAGGGIGNDYKTGVVGDAAAGRMLGTGNPFLEAELQKTRDNISTDVNSTFASNGRFGADINAEGLSEGLASAENTARFNQYDKDYASMIQALGLQDTAASRGLDRQLQVMGQQDNATGRDLDRQLQVMGYQDNATARDVSGRLQGLDMQTGQAADRRAQYDTEYGRKLDAMDRVDSSTAQGLGYAGLLDSKMRERNLADQEAWSNENDTGYNHLAKYLGLLRGGDSGNETNKPLSIWDILGGVGQTVGSFL